MKGLKTTLATAITVGLLVGSVGVVVAQDEVAAPFEFTGQWSIESLLVPDTDEVVNGAGRSTGGAWGYALVDVTDPRFDGEVIAFTNWDDIETATGELTIRKTAWRVSNEDGSWQSDVVDWVEFPEGSATTRTFTFLGEGDYDGLTAVVEVDRQANGSHGLRGFIIDRDLPPDPQPRSIE